MQSPLNCRFIVPEGPDHPGAFGARRKHDVHTGVDLYCPDGEPVYAICTGTVVRVIEDFTGPGAGSPWWNKTGAVMVEDVMGVFLYGEINVDLGIAVGERIRPGRLLGTVAQVLKKDKGRPMSMLHVERYSHDTTEPCAWWDLDHLGVPDRLRDPTQLLLGIQHLEANAEHRKRELGRFVESIERHHR